VKHKKNLTKEQLELLQKLSGIRLPMDQIATMLDISYDTLDRMSKSSGAVRAAIDKGRAKGSSLYRQTVYQMAVGEKNPRMLEFWGKTQEGFKTADRLELTGADGGPVNTLSLDHLSDEELETRLAALKNKL
jgi:hypothetical protein